MVAIEDVRNLTYALRRQPNVIDAEPSFDLSR
jgi:hypothetical protein